MAFLLEPDLKESHGGLRDVSVLRAISAYAPLLADYADLASLEPATAVLTGIRVELHRIAGREQDRLLLQDQDQVAAALAFDDADALMAAVSTAGRQIAWVSDDVLAPAPALGPHPAAAPAASGGAATTGPTATDAVATVEPRHGGHRRGDRASPRRPRCPRTPRSPSAWPPSPAELDRPIAKGSLHRLADRMPPPGDPWPPAVLAALVRLLAAGRPAIDKVESLDQHGLLVRLIPEWAAVRNKPQRNAYHTYTVDRHLLEAAALAAELTDRVERPDLLLIGALLHDIGKGFPGDHTRWAWTSSVGMATRMGFGPDDVEILVDLVRHHLLLPDTATRRDLDDPTTVCQRGPGRRRPGDAAPARRADRGRQPRHRPLGLGILEGRPGGGPGARGPTASSPARRQPAGPAPHPRGLPALMDEVRASGLPVGLPRPAPGGRGRARPPGPALRRRRRAGPARHGRAGGQRERRGRRGGRGLHGRGRPGHLARHGPAPGGPGGRAGRPAGHRGTAVRAGAGLPGPPAVRRPTCSGADVRVDNDASDSATVLEVRAPDEVGLLHRITRVLFEADLDVVSARVSTLGELVVDAFYVREAGGEKVTDPDRLAEITAAIWASLPA